MKATLALHTHILSYNLKIIFRIILTSKLQHI